MYLLQFQVHAYMSSLPEEKVPYIDSLGERHRNKQIIVQLPPYDSEARFCNGLTDEEKRELRIFVALRKRDALDRGVVKQIPDVSEGYSCREVCTCTCICCRIQVFQYNILGRCQR